MTYVFTRDHTHNRVKYKAGDSIELDARTGDWMVAQGFVRAVEGTTPAPMPRAMPAQPVAPRRAAVTQSSPRFKCCGWK